MTNERLPLGYLLARKGVDLSWRPGSPYRGIDRLPHVPDVTAYRDQSAKASWSRFLDAWEEGTIGRDLSVTQEFQSQLLNYETPCEILAAEAVIPPPGDHWSLSESELAQRSESLGWLRRRSEGVAPQRPETFVFLGFDVATPVPDFHSAIFQPGFIASQSATQLNNAGLFSGLDPVRRTGWLC